MNSTIKLSQHIIVKEFQQDATIAFILRNGFTLRVSGDNSTHHQEYNAVYGLSGRQVSTLSIQRNSTAKQDSVTYNSTRPTTIRLPEY